MLNFTRYTIPQIARSWGVKVHAEPPKHGGKVWLSTRERREITFCRAPAVLQDEASNSLGAGAST